MSPRQTLAAALPAGAALLAATCLSAVPASAQTSYLAPDGHNRFPAVTIFCPSGTGVAPCSFGSGGGGTGSGAVSITQGGTAVSASNRFPVTDAMLDAAISGGALTVTGSVGLSGSPTVSLGAGTATVGSVTQSGPWSVSLASGTNALGSVSVSNFPGTVSVSNFPASQTITGAVSQSGNWTMGLSAGSNAIGSVSVSNLPATQPVSASSLPLPAGAATASGVQAVVTALGSPLQSGGSVAVTTLPAIPAGTNAIGAVSVSNLPATQPISAAALPLPTGAATASGVQAVVTALGTPLQNGGSVAVTTLPALPAGSNAIGSVSVSNLPATQPVSAAALPLPSGAATSALQQSPLAPVAPATATATSSNLVGCQASTTLPSFTAGQQGAVPCDTSGRLYVVTVPSANNVPTYLQAVSAGGASVYRAINAASSAMAASVKTTSGLVYGYEACNTGTAAAYLRLFALNTTPTVGTSTPQVSKLVPAGACQTMTTDLGLAFSSGIALDVTSGSLADADTTTVATASQVAVEVYYK